MTRHLLPRSFCTESGSAERLGVFRFVVMSLIVRDVIRTRPCWHAGLPDSLRVPPVDLAWMMDTLLFDPQVVFWGEVGCVVLGVLAAIGFWCRLTVPAVTVLSTWLLALPQFDGKVDHYHHLILFAIVLSVSRCGNAFSFDSWIGGKRPENSPAYGWPIKCVWLLMGVGYFFPGLWKFWSCGLDWINPEALARHIHMAWIVQGTAGLQVDQYPLLLSLAALGTIVFELAFLPMILFRKTRWIAACAGLSFHLGVMMSMGIDFASLMACYVTFLPDRWFEKLKTGDVSVASPPVRSSVVVGTVLVLGQLYYGCRHQLDGWPFACYPTFDYFAGDSIPVVVLGERPSNGELRRVDTGLLRDHMNPAGEWRLLARVYNAASARPANRDVTRDFKAFVRSLDPTISQDSALVMVLCESRWLDGRVQKKPVGLIGLD